MEPDEAPSALPASDALVFGQETGRVTADGRIVGRAEPFIKVFEGSRVVKRAVGTLAWAILEEIGLDARIDDRGRLVAHTNVRRIAANLGISKNTVVEHLGRLRSFGFVFRESRRHGTTGRYSSSHYVLDPSACIERFTATQPRRAPRPKPWDVAASQSTGDGEPGREQRSVVVEEDNNIDLLSRLVAAGVTRPVAEKLLRNHPPDVVATQLDLLPLRRARNPAGVLVASIRENWAGPESKTAPMPPAERRPPSSDNSDCHCESGRASFRQAVDRAREQLSPTELRALEDDVRQQLLRTARVRRVPRPMLDAAVSEEIARCSGIPLPERCPEHAEIS